jgi:exosome complex component RRP42
MFDDDWAASNFIYNRSSDGTSSAPGSRPPITLLVMAVGDNIIFDPSREELAVADSALAVSVGEVVTSDDTDGNDDGMDVDSKTAGARNLRLYSVRSIDPPSRLTAPGVPNAVNAAAWGGKDAAPAKDPGARAAETADVEGVWKAPRGGVKIGVLGAMVAKVMEKGGVADEVLEGLEGVELG